MRPDSLGASAVSLRAPIGKRHWPSRKSGSVRCRRAGKDMRQSTCGTGMCRRLDEPQTYQENALQTGLGLRPRRPCVIVVRGSLPPRLRPTSVGDLDLTNHALVFRIAAPDAVLWLTILLGQDRHHLEDTARDHRAHSLKKKVSAG